MSPGKARLYLLGVGLVTAGSLWIVPAKTFGPPPAIVPHVRDVDTFAAVVSRLQAGEDYYPAMGAELRRGTYPTWPPPTWRTPLHLSAVAWLGMERAGELLTLLALATVTVAALAGFRQSRTRGAAALLLVLGSTLPALMSRPGGVLMPEVWTGVLVGLSIGCYANHWYRAGGVVGVLAVFFRELAVPYGLICGLLAIRSKRSGEYGIWLIGGTLYVVYYSLHAWLASAHVQSGDIVSASSWLRFLGLPFLLQTLNRYGWLLLLPPPWTALALGAGMAAWTAPSMPGQLRLASIAYALLFCALGQPFNVYWGLLTAPIWGFTFVYAAGGMTRLVNTAAPVRLPAGVS